MKKDIIVIDEAVIFTTISGYIVVMNEVEYLECLDSLDDSI